MAPREPGMNVSISFLILGKERAECPLCLPWAGTCLFILRTPFGIREQGRKIDRACHAYQRAYCCLLRLKGSLNLRSEAHRRTRAGPSCSSSRSTQSLIVPADTWLVGRPRWFQGSCSPSFILARQHVLDSRAFRFVTGKGA